MTVGSRSSLTLWNPINKQKTQIIERMITNIMLAAGVGESLFHSTQFLVFLAIAIGGLIGLGFAVIFHHDSDHDIGHDAGVDHGDAHSAPSFLSPRIFFAFSVGFGAAGAGASSLGYNPILASLCGLSMGVIMALIAWLIAKLLYGQQINSAIQQNDVVGKIGTMVTAIPEDGIGEANITVKGQLLQYTVISTDGKPIGAGKRIVVTEDLGDKVIVKLAVA